jgi:ankyrin repeat protein
MIAKRTRSFVRLNLMNMARLDKLPAEILQMISSNLNLYEYQALRITSKALRNLPAVPSLTFDAYRLSAIKFGGILKDYHMVKLQLDYLDDASFLFVLLQGHEPEAIRLLKCHRASKISQQAKKYAIKICAKKNANLKLVMELLKCPDVDVNLMLKFNYCYDLHPMAPRRSGNALHYACEFGHVGLVKQLLADGGICPNSRVGNDRAIHIAAKNGDLKVMKLLINDPRTDASLLSVEGYDALYYAASRGSTSVLKYLLKIPQIDPNALGILG